ncbi:MAG: Uma2 family endonuclease, partial [Planctomycetaceae bacterium]|nr:Uma2 family endonuclease [Planctomycetaceae bacterium]
MSIVLELAEQSGIATVAARRPRRFSLAEYMKMIELGILTDRDKCELIRGDILQKNWAAGSRIRPRHRFSLDAYERMIESGILTKYDHVELIRGEIVEKMTIGEPHAACVMRLNRYFTRSLGDQVIVGIQSPIVAAESRPEPDLVLLSHREDFYSSAPPCPADILLL